MFLHWVKQLLVGGVSSNHVLLIIEVEYVATSEAAKEAI